MKLFHALILAVGVGVPGSTFAAPQGWIPEIGGGVDADEVRTHSNSPTTPAGCPEPLGDFENTSTCPGELVWDSKSCRYDCRASEIDCSGLSKKQCRKRKKKNDKNFDKTVRGAEDPDQIEKKKKKKKKKKKPAEGSDENSAEDGADSGEFRDSCEAPPADAGSNSSCPGRLVWNAKACRHVCRAEEIDCSGIGAKKCKKRQKKADKKFKNQLKKKPNKPKLNLDSSGFENLRDR